MLLMVVVGVLVVACVDIDVGGGDDLCMCCSDVFARVRA
jgi:hypothetical protein